MTTFNYIEPTKEQKNKMQIFRERFESLFQEIKKEIKDSRGKAISLTKLEESSFWLNKSITEND